MRPIRAWNRYSKMMFYDIYIGPRSLLRDTGIMGEYAQLPFEYYEIMESTLLLDRKGENIWEGDILKTVLLCGVVRIDSVIYNVKEGAFTLSSGFYFARYLNEIIGNVYEHPELLRIGEGE
uniref:Putative YopX protein n=1 Tax=viral metagenome TaxID=1070528 RepID=A0A6M3LV77_9ZZZZ